MKKKKHELNVDLYYNKLPVYTHARVFRPDVSAVCLFLRPVSDWPDAAEHPTNRYIYLL